MKIYNSTCPHCKGNRQTIYDGFGVMISSTPCKCQFQRMVIDVLLCLAGMVAVCAILK